MNFTEVIKKVNEDKRLIPDLMKAEKGNNFRAVSESAILDVIDPVLKEAECYYTVEVKKSDLQIREAYGKNGKKLQFIATVEVRVDFYQNIQFIDNELASIGLSEEYTKRCKLSHILSTESVGMGIDDNDKAMGKAYTYALKYALLKVFRLRYSDDPDFKQSEDLLVDKPKNATESDKNAKNDKKTSNSATKNATESKKEVEMSEGQRDYILGLMEKKGISENTIIGKFRVEPSIDEHIPMKVARAIIEWLLEQEDLPF